MKNKTSEQLDAEYEKLMFKLMRGQDKQIKKATQKIAKFHNSYCKAEDKEGCLVKTLIGSFDILMHVQVEQYHTHASACTKRFK